MDYTHTLKKACEFSRLALSLMDDQSIAPHPNNYTVWYNYFSGAFPELKRTLDLLLNNDAPLSEERNAAVYRRFCASPYEAVPLHIMAENMEAELGTVLAVLEQASKGAAQYGHNLETASGKLAETQHAGELQEVVGRLLKDTRAMAEHSRLVEQKLNHSVEQIRVLNEELESTRREAMTDTLTGLANRKLFETVVRQAAMDAMESGDPLSLLYIDVDHFKNFNDKYGHAIGDQVLRLIASILRHDIKGRDTAARIGGEEFAVILPGAPLDGALKVGQAICAQVAKKTVVHRQTKEKLGQITVSIGAAQLAIGEPIRRFVERADEALYLAKNQGRNRVVSQVEVVKKNFAVVS